MFFVYLGLYILLLMFVWGFFIVARIHAYKFKNFSSHITKATNLLLIALLVFSLLGLFFIFLLNDGGISFPSSSPSNSSSNGGSSTYY